MHHFIFIRHYKYNDIISRHLTLLTNIKDVLLLLLINIKVKNWAMLYLITPCAHKLDCLFTYLSKEMLTRFARTLLYARRKHSGTDNHNSVSMLLRFNLRELHIKL